MMAEDFQERINLVERDPLSSIDCKLAECAQRILKSAGRTALSALEMGGWLEAAHSIYKGVGRGGRWSSWLESNVSFISVRTADRYRAIYRRFRDNKTLVSQFEVAALHELSKESTPIKAVDHALLEAGQGEFVTSKDAKAIVRAFAKTVKKKKPRSVSTKPKARQIEVNGGTVTISVTGANYLSALEDAIKLCREDSDGDGAPNGDTK